MATFQEFHGISLAPNSWIENLIVEKLPTDPFPIEHGRVWYNTKENKFKQSKLDENGVVIVLTFATEEELFAIVSDFTIDGGTY